ncbi:6083_t:CDS:2 [Entrophospora sp. SA101]|nr:6083_t:CDS:2 [Entrophospora sp. SA101]
MLIGIIFAADGIGGVSSVVIGVSAGAGIISNSFGSSSESGNIDDFRSIIIN